MFKSKEKPLTAFEFHIGENGGCMVREPWSNGRIWVFVSDADFLAWFNSTVSPAMKNNGHEGDKRRD